jgi:hypothetical protein
MAEAAGIDIHIIHSRVLEFMGYYVRDEEASRHLASVVIDLIGDDNLPSTRKQFSGLKPETPGFPACQEAGARLLELAGLSPHPYGPNQSEINDGVMESLQHAIATTDAPLELPAVQFDTNNNEPQTDELFPIGNRGLHLRLVGNAILVA